MKKNRKVGAATVTNFFTSQFKLKPAQPSKQTHHRKLNTTFNNFKHQLLKQQANQKTRQSKDKKPHIEQLQFLHHKQDTFKIPQSITKRSVSKTKDESRLKLQQMKNQFYDHYQEVPVIKGQPDKYKQISSLTQGLKSKRFNPKDALKQKLERAALQKFNQTILKQNQQNQNTVSQKKAELLYQLLKTARMNQLKQKNMHLKSSPSEKQDEHYQQQPQSIGQQSNKIQKIRKKSQRITTQISRPNKSTDEHNIAKRQSLLPTFEQNQNKRPYQFVPKHNIPKPLSKNQQIKKDLLQPKQVQCDDFQREHFPSNQMQSQQQNLSDSFDLKQQSSIVPSKIKVQEDLILNKDKKITEESINKINRKDSQKSNKTNQNTLKKIELLPLESKNSFQRKKQNYEESDFLNIPNAEAIEKKQTKKLNDNLLKKELNKKQSQFLNFNNNTIEKVLTPKSFEGQKSLNNVVPKINELPKLKPSLQSKVNYTSFAEDDSQIEEIDLKSKKNTPKQAKQKVTTIIQAAKKSQIKKNQEVKPSSTQNIKASIPISQTNREKPSQNKDVKKQEFHPQPIQTSQKQNNDDQQQEDEQDLYDELAYYIERIQDIGHYRMSSKNVYKDVSVGAQLIKSHKICAYYMAHQFLFLSKKCCNHFKSQNLDTDFYDITSQELKSMKQNGILDDQIANLESHVQQSKLLLKKCYEECKMYLPTEEQILILDGKVNHHIKCCSNLIKQFKKVYELFEKNKANTVIVKRCVYLIEIYCSLKLLNGQFIKEFEEFEQIQNPNEHIQKYKALLTS